VLSETAKREIFRLVDRYGPEIVLEAVKTLKYGQLFNQPLFSQMENYRQIHEQAKTLTKEGEVMQA
jgi:hypothetical protein